MSSDSRPQDPFSAQPGEFPSLPDFKEEGFRHSVDLLEGFEEFMDLTPNAPASSFAFGLATAASAPIAAPGTFINESPGADSSEALPAEQSERRQFKNRMSQRRFRERQKERTQALEAELAQTSAQLQQLQALQASLRTKNQLLEKLLHLNKQADFKSSPELPQSSATVLDLYKQRGFKTVPEPMLAAKETLPALRLTIWEGGDELIPVQDIGKLALQEVAKLYTAYVHQMAACLAQLTDTLPTEQSSSSAMQRLSELVIECGSLIVITLISNPKGFKDLQNCNMDERIVCPDAQPPSFYCEVMAAMQHTDSQTQDWLHLRELFYFKIGQLARERKALLINMTQYQMDMGHVSDKLTQMTKWSDHLRENGAEEYRSYCMFATAFLRGISTSKQIATGHVCAFPWIPTVYKLLEAEAVRRGHPPMQTYVEDTSVDDLHHAANFAAVASYLAAITLENLEVHVPFRSDSP